MKTLTIDLKSFCFGVLAMGAVLLMANKPAGQPQTEPVKQSLAEPAPCEDMRRYQALYLESHLIILDTQTGRFLREGSVKLRFTSNGFEEIYQQQEQLQQRK
ncbi:hypothetical protein [Fibrella arboris]|uniref:hypothetical protein n=1 Tax=Fibrella arboris TaxID=3242486 RepID=UPI003521C687